MKNILLKTSLKVKIAIIVGIITVIAGITAISYAFSAKDTKPEETDAIVEISVIEEIPEEIPEKPIEEEEEEISEENQEEKEEDVAPPKTVTYQNKTIEIPKSTVATVNSNEDAEKNKKTGGEEVSQEKAEEMFENVGQKSMGIDVSAHQGKIDWAKVKQSGVDFAIIRCGFRGQTEGKIYEDTYFKTNVSKATANGIKVGSYFYSTAINETEALEEAAWVVNKIAPYHITYPVVYDFEDFGRYRCQGVSGKEGTQNALAFLNYVKSAGYEPMMYANKNDITNKMSRSSFTCKFWLAHYTEQTDYKGSFNMWQYTSKGSVPGIAGRVDMNIAYFNYGKVAEPKHTHEYKTLVGKEKEPTCESEGNKTLRCSCGETKTEYKPQLGHSFTEWEIAKDPTIENEGIQKRTCTRCGKEETKKLDKLPKPTQTPEPIETTKPEEPCTHIYVLSDKKQATCLEDGYEIKKCTRCNNEERIILKKVGHIEGEWIIDKEATEQEEGTRHQICISCRETLKIEKIPIKEKEENKVISEEM